MIFSGAYYHTGVWLQFLALKAQRNLKSSLHRSRHDASICNAWLSGQSVGIDVI